MGDLSLIYFAPFGAGDDIMKKVIFLNFIFLTLLSGCGAYSWEPINRVKYGEPSIPDDSHHINQWHKYHGTGDYLHRNFVTFRNKTPYCTATLEAGHERNAVYSKSKFNPVKKRLILKQGGREVTIDYGFNMYNRYKTNVVWHSLKGEYLATETIGYGDFPADYRYIPIHRNFATQYITLSARNVRECWEKPPEIVIRRR